MRAANEQALTRFANHLSQCQCPQFSQTDQVDVTGGARLFASHLRDTGGIAASIRQESTDPELLLAFRHWMQQQRGACEARGRKLEFLNIRNLQIIYSAESLVSQLPVWEDRLRKLPGRRISFG